jgi:hypothetical protein
MQVVQQSLGEPVQAQVQALTPFGAFLDFDVEAEDGGAVTLRALLHRNKMGPLSLDSMVVGVHCLSGGLFSCLTTALCTPSTPSRQLYLTISRVDRVRGLCAHACYCETVCSPTPWCIVLHAPTRRSSGFGPADRGCWHVQEGQLVQAYIDRVDPDTGRIELTAEEARRPAAALQQSMEDLMAAPEAADPVCSACRTSLLHAGPMPALDCTVRCCMAVSARSWLICAVGLLL